MFWALCNAEVIEQQGLRAHHVGDADHRERQPPRLAGLRIDLAGPARAHAAPQHVDAENAVAVGVERLAAADHDFPPPRLAGDRMRFGDELIAGQRMAHDDDVGFVGVELAVHLIGDGEIAQFGAAVELQRPLKTQPHPVTGH